MQTKEVVYVSRECDATEIPSGKKTVLYPGTELILLQSLGGSFTVMTYMGTMASIAGKEADAIGKPVPPEPVVKKEDGSEKTTEELVMEQLRTCYDPEIPHNIVDLGLVYECKITDMEEGKKVDIKMTLTAPGCGMGEWLRQDVKNKVSTVPLVKECAVEVVFDPPWDRTKMHPALQRELN